MWDLKDCWWECKLNNLLWRTICQFLLKFKIADILSPNNHTSKYLLLKKNTWHVFPMSFARVFFVIVNSWKPECPPVGIWLNEE